MSESESDSENDSDSDSNDDDSEIESDSETTGVPVAKRISAAAGGATAKRTGGGDTHKAVATKVAPSTNGKKKASDWKRKRNRVGSRK